MRTINRRTLNHQLASVLDSVTTTGEAVRVEGRDGKAVLITPAPDETPWERWNRTGVIRKAEPSDESWYERAAAATPWDPDVLAEVLADLEDTY